MSVKFSLVRFLKRNNIQLNRFYAKLKGDDSKTYFGEIYSVESNQVVLNEKDKRLQIFFPRENKQFELNITYEFSLIVNYDEGKNKESVFIEYKNNPPKALANLSNQTKVGVIKNNPEIIQKRTVIPLKANPMVESFLFKNGIKTNRFYGKCILTEKGNYIFCEVISKEDGNFLLDNSGNRQTVFIGKESKLCMVESFYEFSIHIDFDKETNDEFLKVDSKINLPHKLELNPYKEIVRLRYERLDNPEANKMIANLMREIGKGLYSSKQRMIFELLQNADDTPACDEVHFYIVTHEDYFLIMHNGIPFNRDDVEAITSAAESTKRLDRKKTGYKGIGFKSVFTDSEEVIIKSGGYLFSFMRNYNGFDNFDSFYFNKQRYLDYPKLLEEDKLKYTKQRKSFNGNTDIPWQLIPIWQDSVPEVLQDTRFVQFENNNNVGIAIKFGEEKIKGYLDAVAAFAQKPHFMLFLRNVTLFKSFKNQVEIKKSGINPITIERKNWDSDDFVIKYFKKEIDNIEVNDESLAQEGVHIYKREKLNDYGEKNHYFSHDIEGKKEIESIPPKLAAFDKTTITFAAPIIDAKLQAEPEYLSGKLTSSFFTYLPMKEQRISLPFLVNADFVPDSSREKLQGDNQWNEYIIAKIARNHVLWLKELAEQCIEYKQVHPEYLSLLLKEPIQYEDTINQLINKYNSIYLETIENTPFVLTENLVVLQKNEIIIDKIGLSDILGVDSFYTLSETTKKLPSKNINIKYLFSKYLEIEKFDHEVFISLLEEDDKKEILRNTISGLNKSQYTRFLDWFDKMTLKFNFEKDWLFFIPFIKVNDSVFSLEEILKNEFIILNTSSLNVVSDILIKLGFELTNKTLDKYTSIWDKLDVYNIDEEILYGKIANSNKLSLLDANEKSRLITFLAKLDNIGDTKYAQSLLLFKSQDKSKTLKPLGKLISNTIKNLPKWLEPLRINLKEENALNPSFKKYLVIEKNLLTKVFSDPHLFSDITKYINNENVELFYTYLTNLVKIHKQSNDNKIQLVGVSDVPWLYIPAIECFTTPENAYFPDSLLELSLDKYNHTKIVIEGITELQIPHFSSLNLIKELNLGSKKVKFTDSLIDVETIEEEEEEEIESVDFDLEIINDFIEWLAKNNETDFLEERLILLEAGKYIIKPAMSKIQYYSLSKTQIDFISKQYDTKDDFILFDKSIYSENCKKIGLVEGDQLIEKIIDSGCCSIELSKFINLTVSSKIINKYLLTLVKVEIDTNKLHDAKSDVNKVFSLAIINLQENEEGFNKFRTKIVVDSFPLLERAISDDIFFSQIKTELKTKLSEVLTEYKDKTFSLTKVLDSFENIDKQKLKKFFEPIKIPTNKIYTILIQNYTYFNAVQTFFLLYYQKHINSTNPFLNKTNFLNKYSVNKNEYEKSAQEFLTICCNENFKDFAGVFNFPDFNPIVTIIEEKYALQSERLPDWVKKWLQTDTNDSRVKYIKLLGVNDITSPVVLLRKAIFEGVEDMDAARGNLNNKALFANTLIWMKENKTKCKSKYNDDLLKPLYNKAINLSLNFKDFPLPIIENIEQMTYSLESFQQGIVYHRYNSTWDIHKEIIFKYLSKNNIKVVSDMLPPSIRTIIGTINHNVIDDLDQENIKLNSEDLVDKFYTTWPKKNQFIIKKYRGSNLPYRITYNTFLISTYKKNFAIKNGDYYLVCESIINSIPYSIKEHISPSLYADLDSHIREFKLKINKIDYSDEEIAILKKFLNDDEIPESFRKNLNLAALVSALINLKKEGFDVDKANNNLINTHEYAQLNPIYKNDIEYIVMCRSARQGLLYMTAQSWNRLEDDSILLFVDLGFDKYKLFYNKQDVLKANNKDTDYQILRIETDANVSNIDSILDGSFNQLDKLWIIFRVKENKNYDALYYKKLGADNSSNNKATIKNDYTDIDEY